jgi:hypothetical protein
MSQVAIVIFNSEMPNGRNTEIFPATAPQLVTFDRWLDQNNNVHERSIVRLDIDQCMSLVTAIIGVLSPDESTVATPATLSPTVATPTAADVELQQLRQRVAQLEAATSEV